MALEWYWWAVIGVSVVAVGVGVYVILDANSEDDTVMTEDQLEEIQEEEMDVNEETEIVNVNE